MAIARCVLPRPGLPPEDQRPSFGHEVGRERRAEHVQSQRRLIGEVEIVDRLQKRKVRAARESRQARLLPMRDLLGDQEREEIAIGPRLPFGALHEIAPDAPGIREMQSLEERIEIVIGARS